MSKISLIIKLCSLKILYYWIHIKEAFKYLLFESYLFYINIILILIFLLLRVFLKINYFSKILMNFALF